MKIRRAKLTDFRRIVAIDHLARGNKSRQTWLQESIRARAVWALAAGTVVKAYAILTRSFFQRPFIEVLYVAKEERRRGHGECLLSRLEKACVRHGEVWTSTNRSNQAMRLLLKKRGFLRQGDVTGLDKGDPEVFYSKRLIRKKPLRA
jgi:ribosomal protein S18 acetylase RimI-like enzyme